MTLFTNNGTLDHKTLDDMITSGIDKTYEYNGYYYVIPKKRNFYNGLVYKINADTGEVFFINYTMMLPFIEEVKEIDPKTIKRAS